MTDPYEVLGVNSQADDEEIKKAYRELVKKYHPDNYANNPLSDLAEEKMKQVNEAYAEIQKQRASGGKAGNGSFSNGNQSRGYGPTDSRFIRVRELINSGRFSEADIVLESVPIAERQAEWCFLKGAVQLQKGWMLEARKNFEQACRLEPNNPEYRAALNRLNNSYGAGYGRSVRTNECSMCDICAGLACADCLCDCF